MIRKYNTAYNAGILTVSDGDAQSFSPSGEYIRRTFQKLHVNVSRYETVPDDFTRISETLVSWADMGLVDFIITTGGTGLSPQDATPEATLAVISKMLPGIGEVMRLHSFKKSPSSILSRAIAGVRGQCLIVNLPGSLVAVKEYLPILLPLIPHAIDTIKGITVDHHH